MSRIEYERQESVGIDQIAVTVASMDTSQLHVSDEYVRGKYVDSKKMATVKEQAYTKEGGGQAKTMIDPYTGKVLHRDQQAAEHKYGSAKKTEHTSQTDHTVPLKDIYEKHKESAWLTDSDIRDAANNVHNLKEISTHINEQKGRDTNPECIKKHRNEMSTEQKIAMTKAHVEGKISTEAILVGMKVKNVK